MDPEVARIYVYKYNTFLLAINAIGEFIVMMKCKVKALWFKLDQ